MAKITTIREAVKALGGTGKAAAFLELPPSSISNQLRDGGFYRAYHLLVLLELERLGHDVDIESLFGIVPPRGPSYRQPSVAAE